MNFSFYYEKNKPVGNQEVAEIYDTLYRSEHRMKGRSAYPIHKKLNFRGAPYRDIYEWLNNKIRFQAGEVILDAGCGVGYGSLLLASKNPITLHGISLSSLEIERARTHAQGLDKMPNVHFRQMSFDELGSETYDRVIAVESIKHSQDLGRTLKSLTRALKPQGCLHIVEDFYIGEPDHPFAKNLQRDWRLTKVYTPEDYFEHLNPDQSQLDDLTQWVSLKPSGWSAIRIAMTNFMHLFGSDQKKLTYQIFRGGFHLDQLFRAGLMRYQLLTYCKKKKVTC